MKEYLLITLYSVHAALVLAYEPIAFLILMTLISELIVSYIIFAIIRFTHTRHLSYLLFVPLGAFFVLMLFYPQAAQAGLHLGDFPDDKIFEEVFLLPLFYYKNQVLAAFAGVVLALIPALRGFKNKASNDVAQRDFILRTFSVMAVCAVALFVAEFTADHKTIALLIILAARVAMIFAVKNYRRFMWIFKS